VGEEAIREAIGEATRAEGEEEGEGNEEVETGEVVRPTKPGEAAAGKPGESALVKGAFASISSTRTRSAAFRSRNR